MAIILLPRISTRLKAGLMVAGSGAASLSMVIGIPACWAYVPLSSVLAAALLWFAGRESLREDEPGPPFGINSAGSLVFTVATGVWAYACGAKLSLFFECNPQAFAPDGVFARNLWALAGCVAGVVLWEMTESFIDDLRMRHRTMVESCLSETRASQWIALRLSIWAASALLCATTPYAAAVILAAACLYMSVRHPYGKPLSCFVAWSAGLACTPCTLLAAFPVGKAPSAEPPLLIANLLMAAAMLAIGAVVCAMVLLVCLSVSDAFGEAHARAKQGRSP